MRKLKIFAALSCLVPFHAAYAQQPVQWRVQDGGNGHWYRVVESGPDCWADAKTLCEQAGGHLATLATAPERTFVTNLIPTSTWYYLGGYQDLSAPDFSEPSGGWRWITGEPWQPLWASGQPENGANSQHTLCTYRFGLHDVQACASQNGWRYIIEWSADCNADGIVDYGQITAGQLPDTNTNGIPDGCECATFPSLPGCCVGNVNGDSLVDGADLGILLGSWGVCAPSCAADFNRDGAVNGSDLGVLLNAWGPCPG